jgi:hypothetical protein
MVVPPLPALLADATGQLLRDLGPLLGSDAAYEFYDGLILLQNVGKQHGSWMRTSELFPSLRRSCSAERPSLTTKRNSGEHKRYLCCPGAFREAGIQYFGPPVQTLNFGFPLQVVRN